jgi:hypothetical protein
VVIHVIGDVVASREVPDQRRLLDGVATAVADLRDARSAAATTGDEFQAIYDDVATAVRSIAGLRLRLLDDPPADRPVELRIGFGLADDTGASSDAGAPGQSGPGWWRARAALDHLAIPRRGWPPVRWWAAGEGVWSAQVPVVRATLVALDTIARRFDGTDVSLARGLLAGATARKLATDQGITPQSVAARLHDHGVYGWVRTLETLSSEPSETS